MIYVKSIETKLASTKIYQGSKKATFIPYYWEMKVAFCFMNLTAPSNYDFFSGLIRYGSFYNIL